MRNFLLQKSGRFGLMAALIFAVQLSAFAAAGSESYSYDARGRLSQVVYPDGSVISYTYDAAGNRTTSGAPAVVTLTLSSCSVTSPTVMPAKASETCVVGNGGTAGATGIQYTATLGTVSVTPGPATCAPKTANCGTVTVTTNGAAGSFAGSLVATPSTGSPVSTPFTLQVNTAAQLTLGSCSVNSNVITPTQASETCILGNSGQTAASGIVYSTSLAGMSISGPATCAASSGNCGSVSILSPSAAGSYGGTATATPAAGGGVSSNFGMVVLSQPSLSLTGCSTVTAQTPPAQSTFTCTVVNNGQGTATGISYGSTASGTSVSGGPASCTGLTGSCGTVTVTVPAVAGTYAGNLTAVPSIGSGASVSFSLHENSLAHLAFINCSTVSPATSPAVASMTCTLVNNGDNASGVIFADFSPTPPGVALAANGNTCPGQSTCGPWTVSTINGGTFSGTLTTTPAMGTGASFSYNLTQVAPVTVAFTMVSSTGLSTTFRNPNSFAVTPTDAGITGDPSFTRITTNTCSTSIAAGATCSIVFTAGTPDCSGDNYKAYAYVRDVAGIAQGSTVTRTTTTGTCR